MIFPVHMRVQPADTQPPDATCRALGGCLPAPDDTTLCLYCEEPMPTPQPTPEPARRWPWSG